MPNEQSAAYDNKIWKYVRIQTPKNQNRRADTPI